MRILTFIIVLLLLCCFSCAYRYLCILNTGTRSHHIVGSALFKALATSGHDVTVISAYSLETPMKNYHDLPTPALKNLLAGEHPNFLALHGRRSIEHVLKFHENGLWVTKTILEEPAVHQLLQGNHTFDAIITEVFLNEALFGLSEHFNASLIGLGFFGALSWNTDMIGTPSPLSYVPSPLLHFTDRMTFNERIINLAYHTFERFFLEWYYLPRQAALYQRYFPHNKRDMYTVRRNAALVLLNQHVSLGFPRPSMPNQIEVGGMHISRARQPLPAALQRFIDEAPHGVVYFSMGSTVQSRMLPLEKRRALLAIFRTLKQRVLWKYEQLTVVGTPANVYVSAWFPQNDVLAQPNVRGFITHGGAVSISESIYHGKPFVGIPIYGDQFLNMQRAVAGGYGILLDYATFTTQELKLAIEQLVHNATYTQRVNAMSARYRDQLSNPLDVAVYWAEYVVRHKGAKHLHCAGQDLNFWQYHNIDAILVLYGGTLLFVATALLLLRTMWRLCFSAGGKRKRD